MIAYSKFYRNTKCEQICAQDRMTEFQTWGVTNGTPCISIAAKDYPTCRAGSSVLASCVQFILMKAAYMR